MDFKAWLMKGIEIVKLNRPAMDEVASDEQSFWPAVLFFAIGGLASGLGSSLGNVVLLPVLIVAGPVTQVAGSFISIFLLFIIAKLFGGTGTYRAYFSALGVGSIISWTQVVPVLGHIISLWNIPVAVVVTERVHNVSTGKAVAIVLIPIIIAFIVLFTIAAFVGMAAFMGMMNMPGMKPF